MSSTAPAALLALLLAGCDDTPSASADTRCGGHTQDGAFMGETLTVEDAAFRLYGPNDARGPADLDGDGRSDVAWQTMVGVGVIYAPDLNDITDRDSLYDALSWLVYSSGGQSDGKDGWTPGVEGWDVSGDRDGDGIEDVLLAYEDWEPAAFVVDGPLEASGGGWGTIDAWFVASTRIWLGAGYPFPSSAAWVGDTDGDGRDEMAFGDWHDDGAGARLGEAWIVSGAIEGEAALEDVGTPVASPDSFEWVSVSAAGDLDGDGFDDVLFRVGRDDPNDYGEARILLGPVSPGADLEDAARILPVGPGWYVGRTRSAGDVDGDGLDDVLGASWDGRGGVAAWLFLGIRHPVLTDAQADLRFVDDGGGSGLGASSIGAGDLDGDGFGDLAFGAYEWDGVGAAYVVMGPATGVCALSDADVRIEGTHPNGDFGVGFTAVGDVDGDGLDDLLVDGLDVSPWGDEQDGAYTWLFRGPL